MVRWLHISDLHIVEKADWSNFKKELITKCKECGKIDLVIVTGDFHNFSERDDFHLAIEFLHRLLESLELDIERDLFVVPGNHDGVSFVQAKEIFISAAKSKPFDNTDQWVEMLLVAFQGYEAFVKQLIPNYSTEHPASIHSRSWRDRINFIHCNTALAADGKEKTDQLLDVDALAMATYVSGIPNIILAHNSFFDLHQEHQMRVLDTIRTNSIRAYFCGDRHEQSVDTISVGEDEVPCIVSYKGAPDPQDCFSTFGIIFGEWEEEFAELRGWYWKSGEGFSEDKKITGKRFLMQTGNPSSSDVLSGKNTEESLPKIDTDVRKLDVQVKEYTLERMFIIFYYQLTPQQCVSFNKKHKGMPLSLKMTSVNLSDYVKAAKENDILADMVQDLSLILANE